MLHSYLGATQGVVKHFLEHQTPAVLRQICLERRGKEGNGEGSWKHNHDMIFNTSIACEITNGSRRTHYKKSNLVALHLLVGCPLALYTWTEHQLSTPESKT